MIASSFYIRCKLKSNKVKTSLVLSRHRIISSQSKKSKKKSMPRNELNALCLLSELLPVVENNLKQVFDIEKTLYWIDSSAVHSWVNNTSKIYDDKYVQERLEKVRLSIDINNLNLVPSKLNPSDIATRGLKPKILAESRLWFEGPCFLLLNENAWPKLCNGDRFTDYTPEAGG